MTDTQTEYENVNLSKTYINEEEGISFRYPSAWIPLSEEEIASYIDNNEHEYPLIVLRTFISCDGIAVYDSIKKPLVVSRRFSQPAKINSIKCRTNCIKITLITDSISDYVFLCKDS